MKTMKPLSKRTASGGIRPHLRHNAMRSRLVIRGAIAALTMMGAIAESGVACAAIWMDSTGKFQVEAEFVALEGDQVKLKKENGVTVQVPLNRLSAASQQLAKRLAGSSLPPPQTPDAAAQAVMDGLEQGNLRVAWDALPGSYQQDVNDLVHTFANNMDPAVWRSGVAIAQKAVNVLKLKRQFILEHPALAGAPIDPQVISTNWDVLVEVLATVVSSELNDLEKLKTLDVGQFIDGTGNKLMEKLASVAKVLNDEQAEGIPGFEVGNLTAAKVTTVSMDGDTATIRIESKDGEVEEQQAVRVEGKWLPKEMVDGWADSMAQAEQMLTVTMPQQLKENKQSVLLPMKMVEGVLDQLLEAQTAEEFNAVIQEVMETFAPPAAGPDGVPLDRPGVENGVPGDDPSADPFGQ